MIEIKLSVKGMMCEGCEKRITNALSTIDDIQEVTANHNNGTVIIKVNKQIDNNLIKEMIEDLGFEVEEGI